MSGTRCESALPECFGDPRRPQYLERQASRRHNQFWRDHQTVGPHDSVADDHRVLTALAIALSGYLLRDRLFKATPRGASVTPAKPAVSLAILPFRNASGDPNLDWLGPSLADMLSTDVGQSSQLRT